MDFKNNSQKGFSNIREYLPRFFRELKKSFTWLFGPWLFLLVVMIINSYLHNRNWHLVQSIIFCIIFFTVYLFFIKNLFKHIEENITIFQPAGVVMLFVMTSIIIIVAFAEFLSSVVTLYKYDGINIPLYGFNAYYYSTVTFTTLGYGEITPVETTGKVIASVLSLVGITHMVTFISLILKAHKNTTSD